MGDRYIWVEDRFNGEDTGMVLDTHKCGKSGGVKVVAVAVLRNYVPFVCDALNGKLVPANAAPATNLPDDRPLCQWKTADGVTPRVGDRVWAPDIVRHEYQYEAALFGPVCWWPKYHKYYSSAYSGSELYSTEARADAQAAIDAKK